LVHRSLYYIRIIDSMGFPPDAQSPKKGLLVVGHGTRNSHGLAEFGEVARQVAELADEFAVEACFLELAEPTIAMGVQRLLQRGVERLTVAPLLLFAAGHAKRDIPTAVEEAVGGRRYAIGSSRRGEEEKQKAESSRQKAEGGSRKSEGGGRDGTSADYKAATGGRAGAENTVQINQLNALECHPRILELSTQRYAEALQGQPLVPAAETLLILVGRGSSHANAIAAMQKFAALRQRQTVVDRVEVCFAAVAKPTLNEALDAAACSSYRRIVVQPHLLFTGEVLEQIEEAVRQQKTEGGRQKAKGGADKQWIVAPHLGPSNLVAQAVVEMARTGKN
jgi:sirohydrochlorin cobaltochelatase